MQLDTLSAKQEEAAKTERINQRDFEEEMLPPTSRTADADKKDMLAIASRNRMNNWAAETSSMPKLIDTLQHGLVMKTRLENHEFRDRDKSMERSNVPIGPRKYHP